MTARSSRPVPVLLQVAERLYRVSLHLYPSEFREFYGREMLLTFRECCREACATYGISGLWRYLCSVYGDLVLTVTREHMSSWLSMLNREQGGVTMGQIFLVESAAQTDIGRVRKSNEDNLLAFVPDDHETLQDKGALFVVADGMGGHEFGEVASQIAVDTVRSVYYHVERDDLAWLLKHAVERANAEVYQRSQQMENKNMGTTCLAAVLRERTAYIANVGDGRAYLIRDGQIRQVTRDHSWVAEQVLAGAMTEEEARTHEKRNIITRCVGTQSEVEVDIFEEAVQEGDMLLLCTDGLSSLLQPEEMLQIIEQHGPQECVPHLIELANERGGFDNITAIVVRVHE